MERWQIEIARIVVEQQGKPQTCAVEIVALVEQLRADWIAEEAKQWRSRPGPRVVKWQEGA